MGGSNPISSLFKLVGLGPQEIKSPNSAVADNVKPEENSAKSYDKARERAKAANARNNRLKFIVPLGTSKDNAGGIQIR